MTYAELRSRGIEFPASLVSELELANFEIERCLATGSDGRPVPAVRLRSAAKSIMEPPPEPNQERRQLTPGSETDAARRRLRGRPGKLGRSSTRIAAPVALIAAIALVAAVIVAGTSGSSPHSRLSAHRGEGFAARAHAGSAHSGARARPARSQRPRTTRPKHTTTASFGAPRLPATPVSPTHAATLEARGHSLLAAGQSAPAVPILERAVASTGEHLSACLEPTTENCLTYAYALFDLGRALQQTGRAAAAVAVLEQRLKIDNQRAQVAAQLASARQG